jgi:hypothetical protein
MTITLPLQPQEEARLIAAARAKELSTEAVIREAINPILAEIPDQPDEAMHETPPIWK